MPKRIRKTIRLLLRGCDFLETTVRSRRDLLPPASRLQTALLPRRRAASNAPSLQTAEQELGSSGTAPRSIFAKELGHFP